jgi:hypothetical protein
LCASISRAHLRKVIRQSSDITSESAANLAEHAERQIALASFDAAQIRAINLRDVSEAFLSQAARLPQFSNALA